MKVNPELLRNVGTASDLSANGKSSTNASPTTPAAPSLDTGTIQVSAAARDLQSAGATASSGVDAARVAQIKQAISAGQIKINPEKIADKLISSVQQLLSRSSPPASSSASPS